MGKFDGTFKVDGKAYEMKLDFAGVKYLNKVYEGGTYEMLGKAVAGDFELFPHIVRASLIHTGENFTMEDIERAIEAAYEAEELDMDTIVQINYRMVTDNFFFKTTLAKMLKDKPEALEMIRKLAED